MPQGEETGCAEQASSPHAIDWAEASHPAVDAAVNASPHAIKAAGTESARHGNVSAQIKSAKRGKSKKARSRALPSFLREVDLFLSHR